MFGIQTLKSMIIDRALKPVWNFLDGSKTLIGVIGIVLTAFHALYPEASFLDTAQAIIINHVSQSDADLIAALAVTFVGIVDKMRKLWLGIHKLGK